MEIVTILQRITDVMSTNPVNMVVTVIIHTLLLIGLVYTVIHLVKMMVEQEKRGGEERDIIFREVMMEMERKIG